MRFMAVTNDWEVYQLKHMPDYEILLPSLSWRLLPFTRTSTTFNNGEGDLTTRITAIIFFDQRITTIISNNTNNINIKRSKENNNKSL